MSKITDLRNAVDVSGKKLLWKEFSAAEIETQFNLLMNQKTYSADELQTQIRATIKNLPTGLTLAEQVAWVKLEMYQLVNWPGPLNREFWRNFSSAPYSIKKNGFGSNSKTTPPAGAKGMDEIFEGKFETNYSMTYELENLLLNVEDQIKNQQKVQAYFTTNVVSEYTQVEEIIENLPERKAKIAGTILYQDKTQEMSEREKAFVKYGETENSIHQPTNLNLSRIFDIYQEQDYHQRHEMIDCLCVVDWWIDELTRGRCQIDYTQNKYHPTLRKKKRNYTPSPVALQRLKTYYTEHLFIDGVASFELDW